MKQDKFNEEEFIEQLKKEFRELNRKDFSKCIEDKIRSKRNERINKNKNK